MFHSLRNRLILINLAITTIVLVVAFSTIYMIARSSLKSRPPVTVNTLEYSTTVVEVVQERVISDRRATLDSLLTSLITTGIMVELAVAIASYFWAEAAIHPIKEAYESQKTSSPTLATKLKLLSLPSVLIWKPLISRITAGLTISLARFKLSPVLTATC